MVWAEAAVACALHRRACYAQWQLHGWLPAPLRASRRQRRFFCEADSIASRSVVSVRLMGERCSDRNVSKSKSSSDESTSASSIALGRRAVEGAGELWAVQTKPRAAQEPRAHEARGSAEAARPLLPLLEGSSNGLELSSNGADRRERPCQRPRLGRRRRVAAAAASRQCNSDRPVPSVHHSKGGSRKARGEHAIISKAAACCRHNGKNRLHPSQAPT